MILGVGTDVLDPRRLEKAAGRREGRILRRLFTEGERKHCEGRRDKWPSYAARFAAKEAFVKAIGLGIRRGLTWTQVEVLNDELGRPSLRLHGRAREIAGEMRIRALHLSLSHQAELAQAIVILEGEGP